MKIKTLFVVLLVLNLGSAYCIGVLDKKLVNTQEIVLENIDDIAIFYKWEKVILLRSNTDSLVIKEYMTKDDSDYYAKITNFGNRLVVESGRRPSSLLNSFNAYIEIYIPHSNKNITIKTTSGGLEANDIYTVSSINMESSSGSIIFDTVNGNVSAKSSSGNIRFQMINGNADIYSKSGSIDLGNINGNILAESSSGGIELGMVNGATNAKTSSGSIRCTVTENAGDVTLTSTSGSVTLSIPRNFEFNFSSRTSSGNLRVPFSDKLFSPVSDRNITQGVIGGNTSSGNIRNINIRTDSGSIRVNWVN